MTRGILAAAALCTLISAESGAATVSIAPRAAMAVGVTSFEYAGRSWELALEFSAVADYQVQPEKFDLFVSDPSAGEDAGAELHEVLELAASDASVLGQDEPAGILGDDQLLLLAEQDLGNSPVIRLDFFEQ